MEHHSVAMDKLFGLPNTSNPLWRFCLVVLQITKYNSRKYFGLQWCSCSGSRCTQNSSSSGILHKFRMVQSMAATGNGKLQYGNATNNYVTLEYKGKWRERKFGCKMEKNLKVFVRRRNFEIVYFLLQFSSPLLPNLALGNFVLLEIWMGICFFWTGGISEW